ncbi:hypothetical protein ACFLSJ_08465, partial [Verrucomicrobiota bacterium]
WACGFGWPGRQPHYAADYMQALTGIRFLERQGQFTPVMMSVGGDHEIARRFGAGRFFGVHRDTVRRFKARRPNMVDYHVIPFCSVNPVFTVEDREAVPLGYYVAEFMPLPAEDQRDRIDVNETRIPAQFTADPVFLGAAVKEMDGWTSVYIGAGSARWELLNAVVRTAGVHTYLDTGDLVYADTHMIAVHMTGRSGARRVKLPAPCRVTDALGGQSPKGAVTEFTFETGPYDTHIFHLDPVGK